MTVYADLRELARCARRVLARAVGWAPLALSLVALSNALCVDPDYGSQPFSCAAQGRCPAGYRCVVGICSRETTDVARDGGPGDLTIDQDRGHVSPNTDPFGAPRAVTKVNSGADDTAPSLTGDMLEIYFTSNAGGGGKGGTRSDHNIWFAWRSSADAPWETRQRVSSINSTADDTTPAISTDGLMLFFSSERDGGADLYLSTRQSRSSTWSAPARISQLSSPDDDTSPASRDGLQLVFSSSRPGGAGAADLYTTRRASLTGSWTELSPLTELNTASREDGPWAASDRVIYFSSTRPGGSGGADIWRANRDSGAVPFADPTPVPELNSSSDDSGCWVSPDGSTIYFASNRDGDFDVYIAER